MVPSTDEAIHLFASAGGHLTPESCFGQNSIGDFPHLKELRARDFSTRYPPVELILENILHSDGMMFQQSIKYFIELTKRVASIITGRIIEF